MDIQAFLKGIKTSYIEIQSTVTVNSARFLTVSDNLMGLDYGSSSPGSVLANVIKVVLLGRTLCSDNASLHPVFMGYWRIYSNQKQTIHLPLTTNPSVGAILPWMSGIVLSNMITTLTAHKLTMKKLVGMCMRLFFFIIVITMVLPMIDKKMMRNKEDAWIHFSVLVKIRKPHEEAGRPTVVMFELVVLFAMIWALFN